MAEQTAFGTKLYINTGSLTLVANVEEVSFPEEEKVLEEHTAHDSPGGWMEFFDVGVRELKEFTALVGWDVAVATHAQFRTSFTATTGVSMKVEDPTATETKTFTAHIKNIARLTPLKGKLRARITIRPTGQPS